jgi:D-alanyl-D-alanine carboxypeptidase/D-alanyl-D-alanine-endopeptidase (penicillin-binding protein 4)
MATTTLLEGLRNETWHVRRTRGIALRLLAVTLGIAAANPLAAQAPTFFDVSASPATVARRARAAADLSATLTTTLQRTRGKGTWGVLVVSLTNGDTLFGHNADRQLLPASTMKLYTSALALDHFGPEGRFETQILRTGTLGSDGVLTGDLVLRGAGDPTFSGLSADRYSLSPMATLARSVAATGITRVTGAILGDASGYDDSKVPDGWRRRYLYASYAARVSALSFNENQVTVLVRPDGKRAAVGFNPPILGIELTNKVTIVAGSRSARVRVAQDSVAGKVTVSGWIGSKSIDRGYKLVVDNPELFAVGALKAALAAEGVRVDGPIRIGETKDSLTTVASLPSPPLQEMISQMNGESNNHFAELLFRNVAIAVGARGSATSANSLLGRFLTDKVHVGANAVFAADGSGLSTLDRVTPRSMVQLLDYAKKASWGTVLEQSLPIAGRTETLARRMRRTEAAGNLRAKTGTTNDVASLGGYVTASNGENLVFSIIYNGADRWRARDAIDRIGVTLATFTR